MGLNQAFGNGQSQATSGSGDAGTGHISAPETVKDARQIIRRNPFACIGDPEV
jgi:hypothetical protein